MKSWHIGPGGPFSVASCHFLFKCFSLREMTPDLQLWVAGRSAAVTEGKLPWQFHLRRQRAGTRSIHWNEFSFDTVNYVVDLQNVAVNGRKNQFISGWPSVSNELMTVHLTHWVPTSHSLPEINKWARKETIGDQFDQQGAITSELKVPFKAQNRAPQTPPLIPSTTRIWIFYSFIPPKWNNKRQLIPISLYSITLQ